MTQKNSAGSLTLGAGAIESVATELDTDSTADIRQNACPTCGHVPPMPAQGLPTEVAAMLRHNRICVWGNDVIGAARAVSVTPYYYRLIESGKRRPSSTVAAALADALYLSSADYLVLLSCSAFGAGRDKAAVR